MLNRAWLNSLPWQQLGIKGLGLLFAIFAAQPIIFLFLRWAKVPLQSLTATEKAVGRTIGYIERFLAFSFVLDGADNAITMLITAKGVYRLHELGVGERVREVSEAGGTTSPRKDSADDKTYYIMIGTFTSITHAILIAFVTRFVASLF